MFHLNVEIKARCPDPQAARETLTARGADFRGTDRQIDTYFDVPTGRLKLRQGDIETTLIHYRRPNDAGPKESRVTLYTPDDPATLKNVLTAALGVLVVVDKTREIYFIDNVKFHIDSVPGLGSFVEIEAIDADGSRGSEKLRAQCDGYRKLLGVDDADLVDVSYSDMVLERERA